MFVFDTCRVVSYFRVIPYKKNEDVALFAGLIISETRRTRAVRSRIRRHTRVQAADEKGRRVNPLRAHLYAQL